MSQSGACIAALGDERPPTPLAEGVDSITEPPAPSNAAVVPPGSSALPPHTTLGGVKRGANILPSLLEGDAKRPAHAESAAAVAQLRAQIHAATQQSAALQADSHAMLRSQAAALVQARYAATSLPFSSTAAAAAPAAPVVAGGPLASVLPAGHGGGGGASQAFTSSGMRTMHTGFSDHMGMPDSLVGPPSLHSITGGQGASPGMGPVNLGSSGPQVNRGHSLASTGMSLPMPAHSGGMRHSGGDGAAGGSSGRMMDQDTHDIAEALASLGSRTPNSSVLPAQHVPPVGHGGMPPPALGLHSAGGGHTLHMPTAAGGGGAMGNGRGPFGPDTISAALATSAGVPMTTLHGATTAGAGGIVTTTTPAPLRAGDPSAATTAAAAAAQAQQQLGGAGSIGALAAQVQQLAAAMAQTQTLLQAQTTSHGGAGTAQSVTSGGGGSVPPVGITVPAQAATSQTSGGGSGGGPGQSAAMARAAAATAAEAVARALGATGRSDIVRAAVEQALSVVSAMYGSSSDVLSPEATSAPPVMRAATAANGGAMGMAHTSAGGLSHRVGGIVQLPTSMPAVSSSSAFNPPAAVNKPPSGSPLAGHSMDAPAGDSTSVMVAPGEIGGAHVGGQSSPVLPPPGTTATPSGMPPPGSMGTLPSGQAAVGEAPPPAASTDSAGPSTTAPGDVAAAGATAAATGAGASASHPSSSSLSSHSAKQGAMRYYSMAAPAGHLPQQGSAVPRGVNHNAMAAASVAAASRRVDHMGPLPVEGTSGSAPVLQLNSATLQQHALATQATEESAALQHVSASVTGAGEEYAAAQRLSGAVAVGDSLSQPGGVRSASRHRGGGALDGVPLGTSGAAAGYHGRQVHSSTPTLPAMSPAATTATSVPTPSANGGGGALANGQSGTPVAEGGVHGDVPPLTAASQRSVPGTPELTRQERQLVALRESGLRLPSDVGPGAAHGTVGHAAQAAANAAAEGPAPALDNMSMTSGHRSMFTGSLLGGQSGVGKGAGRDYSGSDTATSAVVS